MSLQNVTVSHNDGNIRYSGSWSELGEDQLNSQLKVSSAHSSSSRLSTATFDFDGIMVSVIGALNFTPATVPSLSYIIDGVEDNSFRFASSDAESPILYSSPVLSQGRHSLVMTLLTNESAVFVQQFNVVTNNTALGPSASEDTLKWKTGAIVGGTLGGLVLIIFLALVVVTYFRRKRQPRTVVYTMGSMSVSLPASKEDFTSKNYSNYGLSFTTTPPASTDSFTPLPSRSSTRSKTRKQAPPVPAVLK